MIYIRNMLIMMFAVVKYNTISRMDYWLQSCFFIPIFVITVADTSKNNMMTERHKCNTQNIILELWRVVNLIKLKISINWFIFIINKIPSAA